MSKRSLAELRLENEALRKSVRQAVEARHSSGHYYASADAVEEEDANASMPLHGDAAVHCYRRISDFHELDCRERLNTSSYVNVYLEEDELRAANLGMRVNLADQTVYPQSFKLHNIVLNMIAHLWNCPKPPDFDNYGVFPGAGTVGSTEACLLAGLCLKFRWRKWYAARHELSESQVRGVYPNLVISTCFQACWEKLFRYMDIEPRFVVPTRTSFALTAAGVREQVDEKTIGVVCIMGNHYGGQYDPVWEINEMLTTLNRDLKFQVGIHVDAASGGFIAPFQRDLPPWDFRLPNVLSISASGHKFGESVCGTGWVVWRQRENLSENVAISVSYLGGKADSYTLNFSRPASGIYVQYYKFHRLGHRGYQALCDNRMANAKYLRDALKTFKHTDGRPKFVMLDAGDTKCLSVVTAQLNPELNLPYDDIDLQHQMLQHHWYVSGYKMCFHDPTDEKTKPLFTDAPAERTMFRVVVKANVTRPMMDNLITALRSCVADMDSLGAGFMSLHAPKKQKTADKGHAC